MSIRDKNIKKNKIKNELNFSIKLLYRRTLGLLFSYICQRERERGFDLENDRRRLSSKN
jgi:hypothetical protein